MVESSSCPWFSTQHVTQRTLEHFLRSRQHDSDTQRTGRNSSNRVYNRAVWSHSTAWTPLASCLPPLWTSRVTGGSGIARTSSARRPVCWERVKCASSGLAESEFVKAPSQSLAVSGSGSAWPRMSRRRLGSAYCMALIDSTRSVTSEIRVRASGSTYLGHLLTACRLGSVCVASNPLVTGGGAVVAQFGDE